MYRDTQIENVAKRHFRGRTAGFYACRMTGLFSTGLFSAAFLASVRPRTLTTPLFAVRLQGGAGNTSVTIGQQ